MTSAVSARTLQDEMVRLYQDEQWSSSQIAQHLGISETTIRRLLKEKITLRSTGVSVELIQRMDELASEGWTYREIAEELEVSISTVSKWLRKHCGRAKRGVGPKMKHQHLVSDMITRYESGQSLAQISEAIGVSVQGVSDYLTRAGVILRDYAESSRRYDLDEVYFHQWTAATSFVYGIFISNAHLIKQTINHGVSVAFSAEKFPILSPYLAPLTDISRERWIYRKKGGTYTLKLYSTVLYLRLMELGFERLTIPTDPTFDLHAFWEGYLTCRLNAQAIRNSYHLAFPSETLRQAFLTYLGQQGISTQTIQTSQHQRLRFQREESKDALRALFPTLTQWQSAIASSIEITENPSLRQES